MTEFETRGTDLWPEADFEIRMAGDGLTLEGYAAVFNVASLPMPGPRGAFTETIRSGAFNRTLALNPDVTLRYQHNLMSIPLGRTTAGTLTLGTDTRGLHVQAILPETERGREILVLPFGGANISGMSFSFRIPDKAGEKWSADYTQRDLIELQLGREVSVVDFPAYPDTTVMVRNLAAMAIVSADALIEAIEALPAEERDRIYSTLHRKVNDPFVAPSIARAYERLAAFGR